MHPARNLDSKSRSTAICVLVGLFLLTAGCTEGKRSKVALDSGLPVMRSGMTVTRVEPRGPYLEAVMQIDSWTLPIYAEPSERCQTVLVAGYAITYIDNGPLGVFERADTSCQVMGVGNLELWRDRNRRATPGGVPRAQARYRTLSTDDEYVLLRGQFPLAGAVGFTGGLDIVAIVPNDETCRAPIESGVASMEYRGKGQRALSLVGQRGLCRIEGLVLPLPESRPREPGGE